MVNVSFPLHKTFAHPSPHAQRSLHREHPSIGLTPRKLQTILKNAEDGHTQSYFELCQDIEEKWPRFAAVLGVRKRQIAQLSLRVHPHPSQPNAEKHSELVTRFIDSGLVQHHMISILDSIHKGISFTEIIWEQGQLWIPRELVYRPPQWFEYVHQDEEQEPLLMMRDGPQSFTPLPPHKFIIHTTPLAAGCPHTSGIGRLSSWWYLFYNHAIKDWLGFMELYGKPMRVARYTPTTTEDEKKRIRQALATLGSDGSAIIPDSIALEFLQNSQGQSSSAIYQDLARYIDEQITEVILGQNLTTEVKQGSFAAAAVHDHVRQDIAMADSVHLIRTLERDIVRPLIDLNFGPQSFYPRLSLDHDHSLSRREKIDALRQFIPLGLPFSQEKLFELIGIDPPLDTDTTFSENS